MFWKLSVQLSAAQWNSLPGRCKAKSEGVVQAGSGGDGIGAGGDSRLPACLPASPGPGPGPGSQPLPSKDCVGGQWVRRCWASSRTLGKLRQQLGLEQVMCFPGRRHTQDWVVSRGPCRTTAWRAHTRPHLYSSQVCGSPPPQEGLTPTRGQVTWSRTPSGRPQILAGPRSCAGPARAGAGVWGGGATLLRSSGAPTVPPRGRSCRLRAWLFLHGGGCTMTRGTGGCPGGG